MAIEVRAKRGGLAFPEPSRALGQVYDVALVAVQRRLYRLTGEVMMMTRSHHLLRGALPLVPAVCLALIFLLAISPVGASGLTMSLSYPASGRELANPYIGNAVWATDPSQHEQPFSLAYATVLWADLEPEEGGYAFDAFENTNQFSRWREEGKHIIFRFVMDRPGKKTHRDIPDWLWQKTNRDGQNYDNSYGLGYSPNYENPILIQAHAKAIRALGQRYGQDPLIAYVQLGSLGHWGEWHIRSSLHPMPLAPTRALYIAPYLEAFPLAKLMMRRPFAEASRYNMGLYNDTAGDLEPTETWLEWIASGGAFNQTDEQDALVPMGDAWMTAPVGGELSTRHEKTDYLEADTLEQTLSLFERSHTSWIGPGSFVDVGRGGEYQRALDEVNRTIGYRLRVSQCDMELNDDGSMNIILAWANSGIAPFYFDWLPTLRIKGSNGEETLLPLDMRLQDLLPGEPVQTVTRIDARALPEGGCAVFAGIVNPATGEAGIALAMDTPSDAYWYELFRMKNDP